MYDTNRRKIVKNTKRKKVKKKSKEEEEEYMKKIKEKHRKRLAALIKRHKIEQIGGCRHCQPNVDWDDGWYLVPEDIGDEFWEEDCCCSEINWKGEEIMNTPEFCKYKEEKKHPKYCRYPEYPKIVGEKREVENE